MGTAPAERPEALPTPRRRRRRVAMLLAAAGAVALALLLSQLVILPWLVRGRVVAALRDAGFDDTRFTVSRATLWGAELTGVKFHGGGAARVEIAYGLRDLWHGRIDRLRVTSLREVIEPPAPTATTQGRPVGSLDEPPLGRIALPRRGIDLPVRRIELADSAIVLAGDRAVEIPLRASLERQGTRYNASLTAGEREALSVQASADQTLREGEAVAAIRGPDSDLLVRVVRLLTGGAPVSVSGRLDGNVTGEWGGGSGRVSGKLEVRDGKQAGPGQLNVWGGVYSGEARFGPSTRPTMTLNVKGGAIATSDLVAEGVGGKVMFSDLAPPATLGPQELTVSRLKVGEMEMTDGRIEFDVKPNGDILVRRTSWNWLGGQVLATDVTVPRAGPTTVTLSLRDVELAKVLDLLAEKKATGQGKLSGELPVAIDGSRVRFGDGALTVAAGGNLQIKDAATLTPAGQAARAVAPAGASQEQIKKNIVDALSDFQFDRLTGRLVNEPDGLAAYVRMSGRGRTGARQALDYDLRVHGLDAVLRSYTSYQNAMNSKPATTGKAGP